MRAVKPFLARGFLSVVLLFLALPLRAAGEGAAPAASTETNLAPSAGSKAAGDTPSSAGAGLPAADPLAIEKRIRELESEIVKLWNYANSIRRAIPGEQQIGRIADARAATLINRYLGGKSDDPTRIPVAAALGGLALAHIVVGGDSAEESMSTNGLRIALVARGPKTLAPVAGGRAFAAVYALPESDLVLRPEWLIHVDDAVPYIDGNAQTHFIWRGNFADGTKAAKGKYHIFVRVIIGESEEKSAGSAMRYWGANTGSGIGNSVLIRD